MLEPEINKFLTSTIYCDCDNPAVKKLGEKIAGKFDNDRTKAMAIFDYVRDGFKYAFGDWRESASETMLGSRGMCTTKANLLVALLRSQRIPAGFRIIRINARQVFSVFTPFNFVRKKISTNSVHIFAAVFLNNHWLEVDPSLDLALIRGVSKSHNYGTELLDEWDGKSNFYNFIHPHDMIEDLGLFASIDNYHEKKRRTAHLLFNFITRLNMSYYRLIGRL